MRGPDSFYYPERASSTGTLRGWWYGINRRWHLDNLPSLDGVSWWLAVASFFVPSLGFWGRWPAKRAALVSAVSVFLLLLFFASLGLQLATYPLGLLFAIHVSGFLLLFRPWLMEARLPYRISLIVTLVIGYAGMFYMPAQEFVHEHFFMPLRISGKPLIVNRLTNPNSIRRGEWVVFAHGSGLGQQIRMQAGYSASPVFGLPGDQVLFTPSACVVNGVPYKRREFMPTEGQLRVPQGRFFVWPEFAIYNRHLASRQEISNLIMSQALVTRRDFTGKPYKRWFWRKSELL